MKVSAIVYSSNTGFTAQYATLLSHQTGLPLFYLRGGYSPARVRGKYKMMMAMMKAILSKKTDSQSREALEAMERGADWVSAPQLEPVLNWLWG
ncbi:MAG: hypothetical protein MSB10_06885 [Clostridiales bacterium]|uniref:hypothetical protein n=1 Tax=Flavonifractor porci TaxID=3133422 RepID=UPI0030A4E857|nr:hypothetical protein [Clostridiales bacterium]